RARLRSLHFPTRRSSDLSKNQIHTHLELGKPESPWPTGNRNPEPGTWKLGPTRPPGTWHPATGIQKYPDFFLSSIDVSDLLSSLDRKSTRLNSSHVKISY